MGKQESVRSAVPRPSNPKILRRLEATNRIKLGRTDRNTVFVFEHNDHTNERWWRKNYLPIAIAPRIVSKRSDASVAVLEDVLVLGTLNTSRDVSILIPNTTRHIYLADQIEDHLVNFGAMDDCVHPDCKRCRRSAQCLTGGICHCVMGFGRFSKYTSSRDRFLPGDRYNQWTFSMTNHIPLRTMSGGDGPTVHKFDIWLCRTEDDKYELEFTRSV